MNSTSPLDLSPAPPRCLVRPRLTPRQVQVMQLAAQGMSYKEIGNALHIREETAKVHSHNAQRRLGARNRVHACLVAIRMGLIAFPTA